MRRDWLRSRLHQNHHQNSSLSATWLKLRNQKILSRKHFTHFFSIFSLYFYFIVSADPVSVDLRWPTDAVWLTARELIWTSTLKIPLRRLLTPTHSRIEIFLSFYRIKSKLQQKKGGQGFLKILFKMIKIEKNWNSSSVSTYRNSLSTSSSRQALFSSKTTLVTIKNHFFHF